MVQGTGKFIRYRGKYEIEKFEIKKDYAVFLGQISRDRTFCSRQRDIRNRGQSRQRELTVLELSRRSDATTFEQNKEIFLSTLPRTGFNTEVCSQILKIHKRTLQIVYNLYDESYENLWNRSDDILINQKHLRYLAIEVYKYLAKLNSAFLWNFIKRNHIPHNLQRDGLFLLPFLLPSKKVELQKNLKIELRN